MTQAEYISDVALESMAQALQNGDVEHAFTQLAVYLKSNELTLSDDVFRIYLRDELFSCVKDRGELFIKA